MNVIVCFVCLIQETVALLANKQELRFFYLVSSHRAQLPHICGVRGKTYERESIA